MKICRSLGENHIVFELEPNNKKKVLEDFMQELKKRGLISKEKIILEELLKRESLGSTGLEHGIAIPHTLTDEVDESFLALAVIKRGVNFEAVDQMPTYVLFLLLGNKKDPGMQLKILAHVCRLVKETRVVEKLKHAESPGEVCVILEEEEGKIE